MAGTNEPEQQNVSDVSDSFVWDDESKLYYHASSGFYHDPNCGWYFSSRDGLYYKFENGSYVLLQSNKDGGYQPIDAKNLTEPSTDPTCNSDPFSSNDPLEARPPSEWLEDTLINLYLMGYPNSRSTTGEHEDLGPKSENLSDPKDFADVHEMDLFDNNSNHLDSLLQKDVVCDSGYAKDSNKLMNTQLFSVHMESCQCEELLSGVEECEMPPHLLSKHESSGEDVHEVGNSDEDNWRAQYGQVGDSITESVCGCSVVDLWDWTLIEDSIRKKKHRLMGRPVKKSTKLHPSVPSGGGLLKTAPISEVQLDLVRVSSGRIYRLRNPSKAYLSSISKYDSSNPTKDWDYPDLSQTVVREMVGDEPRSAPEETASETTEQSNCGYPFQSLDDKDLFLIKRKHIYRDRAAERRKLHGGFGIGLGQKDANAGLRACSEDSEEFPPESLCPFATGGYGRRILECMGWKEGEALGKTQKGLLEPLRAVGNRGSAGLGWKHDTNRPHMNS